MKADERDYPRPILRPGAGPWRSGRPLPLTIGAVNDSPRLVSGAVGELTLETEPGVLVSWQVEFRDLSPGNELLDAVARWEPEPVLPLNVSAGPGELRMVMTAQDGSLLNEDRARIEVS